MFLSTALGVLLPLSQYLQVRKPVFYSTNAKSYRKLSKLNTHLGTIYYELGILLSEFYICLPLISPLNLFSL